MNIHRLASSLPEKVRENYGRYFSEHFLPAAHVPLNKSNLWIDSTFDSLQVSLKLPPTPRNALKNFTGQQQGKNGWLRHQMQGSDSSPIALPDDNYYKDFRHL